MNNWLKKLFGGTEPPPPPRPTPREAQRPPLPDPPAKPSQPPLPAGVWQPGQLLLGDFVVERTLGEGGMGRVWLIKSDSTGRRFAVKQALIRDERHRKAFLTELQTWIDLPEHPNIVPCRFFRTVGDEVVIFADFIEGGSLADWISKGKLTSLEKILDIAIQFGWGLHAIHQRGLIHQDVKPGNVLMTLEGTPMVADFGLSRARFRAADGSFVSPSLPQGQQSMLVSSGGMTPAYASPEQRAGQPVSRKTDIWSWGVSVMDMFAGGVSSPHGGHIAAEILEYLFDDEQVDVISQAMPLAVKEILRRCFAPDFSKRWDNFEALCSSLMDVYGQLIGKSYQGTPSRSSAEQDLPVEHDRKIQHGRWRDPRTWLREAYRATDRDPADAERYQAPAAISRRGAEVADLAIYHEVERLLTSVIGPDDERNANLLASFYADKALLCFAVHDSEAVFSAADTCIAIRERLVIKQKHREFAADLASAYMHKAIFCKWSGDHVAAQALYDKCISILDPLVEKDGRIDLTADLARAYMNKAVDLTEQGKVKPAIALFDKSIAALRSMGRHGNAEAMNDDLAHVFMNKAGALLHIGNAGGAAESYEMCINIRAPLVERGGRRDLENDLASAYLGRGVALNDLGNYEGAMKMFDQAIQIMERLVVINRNTTLATELARSYLGKANALRDLKNFESAELLYRKACDIWERLVVDEGQRNAANDLANVYMCMANAKRAAGDLRAALQLHEKCIGIRERLIATDENAEVDVDLAKAYMNKGNVLNELGGHTQALAAHDKCIAIYERMVHEQGREELEGLLAEAYANKAAPAKKLGDLQQATSLYEKSITIYERLTRDGRTDKLSELAWAQLSRASVLLASGNMGAEDVVRAREAFKLACRLAEETGQLRAIQLVEWSKQTLRAVLFEGISSATLEFCLPSGLKGCISCAAAIIDFSDVTKWLRCPPGHFWFVTPNVNMSPPPYGPRDEIVLDEVSAPAPQNRREAMEFVHVYIEGDGRGLFWRGDWMDSFHESYPLGPQDKKAWLQWVSTKGEYLDSVLERASREAARAARIKDTVQYGPFARYSLISASEIPRLTNHQSADHSYKLSELVGRSYRLTSGMRQTDYETAINVVAGNLHEQGCRIISTEQDRNAPCSIIAQSPSGSVGVKVVVTRAPDQPQYDQEDVRALREFCTRKADRCAIAPVGLMPGTKRSPEGDQEFYVRYEGLVSV